MFFHKKSLKNRLFTKSQLSLSLNLALGAVLLTYSSQFSVANQLLENKNKPKIEADFDTSFLSGSANLIDATPFKFSNPILPGEYNLDVYVNKKWYARKKMVFTAGENKDKANLCFTKKQMLEYGVKDVILNDNPTVSTGEECLAIDTWVDAAFYDFDSGKLRLDISIPQIAMANAARDFVDPRLWDRGINAGFLSYTGGAFKVFNNEGDDRSNAYMSITAGANIQGWQLRHNGQLNWSDQTGEKDSSIYQANNTYLRRAFPKHRTVVTMGENNTSGDIFDSLRYRGLDLTSDVSMLPNSLSGYAPQIRGNAKTSAKVEIRQQGNLVYQTSVAPGPFEINDLYPTGIAGELEVTVLESTGDKQEFVVPYASLIQMLRPGLSNYSFTTGKLVENDIDLKPWFTQAKYQRGLTNNLTAYTGVQWLDGYGAVALGAALGTSVGAISLDLVHSSADFDYLGRKSGQSYRLSYSKLITSTSTNITLAAYRYSTKDYYSLSDAVQIMDYEKKNINDYNVDKARSEFQVSLNQELREGWGNFYVVGSIIDYWNKSEESKSFNIGYNNKFKSVNYGLSANNRRITYADNESVQDTQYLLNISFPLDFGRRKVSVNSNFSNNSRSIGFSGSLNDQFNYSAGVSHQDDSETNLNINAQYRAAYMQLGGGYNVNGKFQQANLQFSGNVVAHAKGVSFGAENANTMAVVYAPDAVGAKVSNARGLKINRFGYAIIPYMTPYRFNTIQLDPSTMSLNTELLESSQRVVPYAGAILRVKFSTKTGYAIFIKSKLESGEPIPFYAPIYDEDNQLVGNVAQGSLVYIRSKGTYGKLKVKLSDDDNSYCSIDFNVDDQVKSNPESILITEAVCMS